MQKHLKTKAAFLFYNLFARFINLAPPMKTLAQFQESLSADKPNDNLPVQLKSLWHDGKGDWRTAHDLIDHLTDRESAWVHAYLHRKEGDSWNADYWYGRARQVRPNVSLHDEWEQLAAYFLKTL